MNALLFISTVIIWGTTWIAISWQLGAVPVLVSVFYRFALAGIIFLFALAALGQLKIPEPVDQKWILLQALCLFSLNFICFYHAAAYIPSGMISVIFSLATLFNTVNARLFFNERISGRAVLAGVAGVTGLTLLFAPELETSSVFDTIKGTGLAALGTLFFSLGNMVSRRNSTAGISPLIANAWGILAGAGVLLVLIMITDTQFVSPPDFTYLTALFYLAGIGTIVGFTTYLSLVARIGSDKAAYATVLFPIVALGLSSWFEDYSWNLFNMSGLMLTLVGNLIMFAPTKKL